MMLSFLRLGDQDRLADQALKHAAGLLRARRAERLLSID